MSPILLDSAVGIVILLSVVFAYFRGFVKEMLTIVNLGGAAAASYFFAPQLRPQFNEWFGVVANAKEKAAPIWGLVPPEIMAAFCAYASAFFGVFLILTLAGLYISSSVTALGLKPVDKVLGVAFGALRGFMIVFLFYLPFAYFMKPTEYPAWAQSSVSVAVLQDAYEAGKKYMDQTDPAGPGSQMEQPDSMTVRLRRMADEMAKKQPSSGNAVAEFPAEDPLIRNAYDSYHTGTPEDMYPNERR